MKIIQVHNKYQTAGGEDSVVEAEYGLLTSKGHDVHQWFESSEEIKDYNWIKKLLLSILFFWSFKSYRKMQKLIRKFNPDIVHVHNTVPLITPSIYYACKKMNVPVVQTLHNHRLFCANGLLFRDGKICEKCLEHKNPFYSVKYSCYRKSKVQSLVMSLHLWFYQKIGTYKKYVSIYISLTHFAKSKSLLGGLPKEKIHIKPNFINSSNNIGKHDGNFALFVGRLSEEKGIKTLLKAWNEIGNRMPLKIVGKGPLEEVVRSEKMQSVSYLGWKSQTDVLKLMRQASFLVFPSECYEGFPMTIIEAFSVGLPVVASDLGGPSEIIKEGVNGWKFEAGNAYELGRVILKILEKQKLNRVLNEKIVQLYNKEYGPEKAYENLLKIYNRNFL